MTTGTDGNFELILPTSQPCKLQVFKPGHTFEGDGILHVEQGQDTFALTKPLDGVRFYDQTKVRLVGRVAGGNDQRDLKHGFGLGKNNLGDNLQLVLMLEGDNTSETSSTDLAWAKTTWVTTCNSSSCLRVTTPPKSCTIRTT